MADTNGHTPDSLIDELVQRPYAFDFFRAIRLLESQRPELPRVGFSISPTEDPVRFWQHPSMRFAPASLDSVRGAMIVEIELKLGEILKKRAPDAANYPLRIVVHPTVLERLQIEDAKKCASMIERCAGKLSFDADAGLRTEKFRIINETTKEELARGDGGIVPRMAVNFFGLFGPNAPMPPHITEYVLERELHHRDPTITAFFNVFHHRLISLFYRAWAASQKAADLDRPTDQRYSTYIGSLFGIGMAALQERDAVPDTAKLFFAGRLAGQTRNKEGLESILREYFHIPAEVYPFTGRWLTLPADSVLRMGESPESGSVGVNSIVGSRFWDCQLSFRMKFGPMSLVDYERMLPQGDAFERVKYWVLNYCGEHFFWDVQLVLRADEVPTTRLGVSTRIGWTSWLKTKPFARDADELILTPPAE